LRKLWRTTAAGQDDGYIFNFDPNCINWRLYLLNTHIPAALKISRSRKNTLLEKHKSVSARPCRLQ
ncbi:hypothetical protein BAE44_0019888, partial [Dichanthelium oligosanthes]